MGAEKVRDRVPSTGKRTQPQREGAQSTKGTSVMHPKTRSEHESNASFETTCIHVGEDRMAYEGAAVPPIFQTSTFIYPEASEFSHHGAADNPHWDYTRVRNPTTAILEAKLAHLEHASWARAFGSGMGAISAAISTCVRAGTHVVCTAHCYGPTRTLLDETFGKFGVATTYVEGCNPDDYIHAIRPETALVYLESPTSATFEVPEIRPITNAARARGIRTILDNSWASPYFQNPLVLGCDLVVHSATKFIGGHSDVVAGAVVGLDSTLKAGLMREAELLGAVLDPFAAWLLIRGLRTLRLRMEQHQKSGLAVAQALATHPKILQVNHPGLRVHPQYDVAQRQLRGFPGLFSFALADQSGEAARQFLDRLRLFHIGVSWGGHESLAIEMPSNLGAPPDGLRLIRMHVGLEATDDIVADVVQALEGT
jgi:cystathionine beta-lyase/cystathionine gamma-synthase